MLDHCGIFRASCSFSSTRRGFFSHCFGASRCMPTSRSVRAGGRNRTNCNTLHLNQRHVRAREGDHYWPPTAVQMQHWERLRRPSWRSGQTAGLTCPLVISNAIRSNYISLEPPRSYTFPELEHFQTAVNVQFSSAHSEAMLSSLSVAIPSPCQVAPEKTRLAYTCKAPLS